MLRSQDGIYTFHVTTLETALQGLEPVMTLDVLEDGAPLAAVDIGGFTSEPRARR